MTNEILSSRTLRARLAKVKLFLCDSDGVLTEIRHVFYDVETCLV